MAIQFVALLSCLLYFSILSVSSLPFNHFRHHVVLLGFNEYTVMKENECLLKEYSFYSLSEGTYSYNSLSRSTATEYLSVLSCPGMVINLANTICLYHYILPFFKYNYVTFQKKQFFCVLSVTTKLQNSI